MNKLIIYGAGGFGRELACLINAINEISKEWELVGYIDDGLPVGHSNKYGKVLGNIDTLNSFTTKTAVAISIASPDIIKTLTERVSNPNIWFPNLFAPDVKFHDRESLSIGEGNVIFFSCRISCDVRIGNFNIMNSLVSLGHDVEIGNCNVMNPNVRISGNCEVGNGNSFGVHSTILQGKKIGSNVKIGVSSVVMRNTQDNSVYFGNPAKKMKM